MNRYILNVATGPFVRGQQRLLANSQGAQWLAWTNQMPPGSPSHRDVPYAFKAHAIQQAAQRGADLILWADASILPIRSLEPLWQRIETDGYWIGRNGWKNSQWTADSAYPLLGISREENELVPHVVAGTFGLNLRSEIGQRIFSQYLQYAVNGAFKGPWKNGPRSIDGMSGPCGPATTLGHRHDQTALSVVAWRVGCVLTNPPDVFSYRGGETEQTILVADSNY